MIKKMPKNNMDNGKVTVIVYLRKKIKNENVEDFNMGSTSVGGILLTAKLLKYKLNNPEIVDKIQKYCNVTVIKPNKQMFKNII
tara:strand:- start:21 stop:272 length:252 start_codon:yes stop_codon:yes gene_type:complete